VRAARANLLPGLVVQGLMLLMVVLYYGAPAARPAFNTLAAWKASAGFAFSMASAVIAGAVAPELLKILCFQRGIPTRENARTLLFASVLWAGEGALVDAFYRLQSFLFGDDPSLRTIATKVFVDQFIYNPLLPGLLNAGTYYLIAHDLTPANVRYVLSWTFYKHHIIPVLIATWGVWIPVVCAVYAVPPLLQFPLFSLALTFWATMLAWIGAQSSRRPSPAAAEPAPTST
jgi:hypothetical protein